MIHCKPIPCNENRVFPVYSFSQGNPCNEYRVPVMRTGFPCNENRLFPVRKSTQGKSCSGPVLALYGIAVQAQFSLNQKIAIFTEDSNVVEVKRDHFAKNGNLGLIFLSYHISLLINIQLCYHILMPFSLL